MTRQRQEIPLCWHEHVSPIAQGIVTARRHRYVLNAQELEGEGYVPVSQVTIASGRLLRRGESDVITMVEHRVRKEEELRIRRDARFYGKSLDIRFAKGTVVPLVEPKKVAESRHFRASRQGFTVYVKEVEPLPRLSDLVQIPKTAEPLAMVRVLAYA